jgi:hypothetical protein
VCVNHHRIACCPPHPIALLSTLTRKHLQSRCHHLQTIIPIARSPAGVHNRSTSSPLDEAGGVHGRHNLPSFSCCQSFDSHSSSGDNVICDDPLRVPFPMNHSSSASSSKSSMDDNAYRNYYLWDPHSCRLRIC